MKFLMTLSMLLVFSVAGTALAAPTPEPGGANQVHAVAGTLSSTLFNGTVRVKKMAISQPTSDPDASPGAGEHLVVFSAVMSNGTSKSLDMTQFAASLADADGVTINAQPDKVKPMGGVYGVAPGAAWREKILFSVPADFKPVKLLLVPGSGPGKAFRITL